MADPTQTKPIRVTFSGTGSVAGQTYTALNRTTGERIHDVLDANKKAIFDCANFASAYSDGDIIELNIIGPCYGTATITLSGKASQSSTLSGTQRSSPVATDV